MKFTVIGAILAPCNVCNTAVTSVRKGVDRKPVAIDPPEVAQGAPR
jgi:hypothetical protein